MRKSIQTIIIASILSSYILLFFIYSKKNPNADLIANTQSLPLASRTFLEINESSNTLINNGKSNNTHVLTSAESSSTKYSFINPDLAKLLYHHLYKPIPIPYSFYRGTILTKGHNLMQTGPTYCNDSLNYFFSDPQYVFDHKNILAYYHHIFLKKLIPSIGTDLYPNLIYRHGDDFNLMLQNYRFSLLPNIHITFLHDKVPFNYTLDEYIGCNHQLYNNMFGIYELYSKAEAGVNYKNYIETARPECVEPFMPASYLLSNKTQCIKFFKIFNSNKYLEEKKKFPVIYVLKVGALKHSGLGVHLVDGEKEVFLRKLYDNGNKCGIVTENYQLQKYIPNPLLIQGRKFDFRIYMLIASTNPLIVYYHDGHLRISIHEYDPDSKIKGVHLTNMHMAKHITQKLDQGEKWNGMTKDQIVDSQAWTMERLQEYLLESGKVNDKNWLENDLRQKMKKAMVHIVNMTKYSFWNRTNTYQLMGVDFILDDDLKLWFIEANTKPGYGGGSPDIEACVAKVIKDHFELMFVYYRSRIKRIVNYLNELSERVDKNKMINYINGEYPLPSYEEDKKKFERINQNYLEPEFEVSKENGWVKVIDENYEGIERYAGLIAENCV